MTDLRYVCDMNTHISACRWKGKFKDYGSLVFSLDSLFSASSGYLEQVTLADETSASPPVMRIIKSLVPMVDGDDI